ncbi:uncharacterized protein C8R40DRAFT_239808 [Lentinula edodes]|uniref:uncharacterized protein n=1 Tax=Lentinula edodes TaxID=5353 RepID=UPI001E8EB598|nr:uncharacterized protein C8R40DRAFT_239808 [Lentinula edodes]KAH7874995.1 hypothetical protein C8R40DRAFT_239808 [Lentinula edodes]
MVQWPLWILNEGEEQLDWGNNDDEEADDNERAQQALESVPLRSHNHIHQSSQSPPHKRRKIQPLAPSSPFSPAPSPPPAPASPPPPASTFPGPTHIVLTLSFSLSQQFPPCSAAPVMYLPHPEMPSMANSHLPPPSMLLCLPPPDLPLWVLLPLTLDPSSVGPGYWSEQDTGWRGLSSKKRTQSRSQSLLWVLLLPGSVLSCFRLFSRKYRFCS